MYPYDNVGSEHHSTLEVKRDDKPAWDQFKGMDGRWGDFRSGPQMFEIAKLDKRSCTPYTPVGCPLNSFGIEEWPVK